MGKGIEHAISQVGGDSLYGEWNEHKIDFENLWLINFLHH